MSPTLLLNQIAAITECPETFALQPCVLALGKDPQNKFHDHHRAGHSLPCE